MSRGLDDCHFNHVYRTLRPDESPYRDIVCKDRWSNRSIGEHVEDGLKHPSRFISTTTSFEKAERWIHTSYSYNPPKYSDQSRRTTIIEIDVKLLKQKYPEVARSAYDLTRPRIRENFLTNELQSGYATAYREVAFETRIPLEAISRIYEVGRGWVERVPKEQQAPISAPKEQQATISAPEEQQATISTPEEEQATISVPEEQQAPISTPEEEQAPISTPEEQQATISTPKEQQAPISVPEPLLSNPSPAAPHYMTPLVVNNNISLQAYGLTLGTHYRSTTSSTTNDIQVGAIPSEGTARFKRKLTNIAPEPPLKYICEEVQICPTTPMLTRAQAKVEAIKESK